MPRRLKIRRFWTAWAGCTSARGAPPMRCRISKRRMRTTMMATLRRTWAKCCGNWDSKTRRSRIWSEASRLGCRQSSAEIDAASPDLRKLIGHAARVDVDGLLCAGRVRDHAHCAAVDALGAARRRIANTPAIGNSMAAPRLHSARKAGRRPQVAANGQTARKCIWPGPSASAPWCSSRPRKGFR